MTPDSIARAEQLTKGERLLPLWDAQNAKDPHAIALRTGNAASGDVFIVGYCPRYLSGEICAALKADPDGLRIEVVAVNLSPAPIQLRVLYNIKFLPQCGAVPFTSEAFRPLAETP
jgi:hypothetical protein